MVTNNHVIAEADEISVRLSDGSRLKAVLVGRDAKTDLALLKVEPKGKLPALKWGNSGDSRVGDWVLAIGNPFGLGGSVTAGIISARGRDINSGPYDDFFQTDAAINRGNSGGPLFNMKGEVIGINTAIYSPTGGSVGIGFAIPVSFAKDVMDQIIRTGRVTRGWIGVEIQDITPELAGSFGLPDTAGALIAGVIRGGPADKGGILPGDVLIAIEAQPIADPQRMLELVAALAPGAEARFQVRRKGRVLEVPVKIGRRPVLPRPQ